MTRNRVGSGITARLMGLVVLTMTPVFLLFLTSASRERARASELAEETLRADAFSTATQLEGIAKEVERFLATMSVIPGVQSATEESCSILLGASEIDERYLSLALVDPNGDYICQTLDISTEGVSVVDRAWLQQPLATRQPYREIIREGRLSHTTVFVLSHVLVDAAGTATGVLAAGLDLAQLLSAGVDSPHNFGVGLADADGVLASSGAAAPIPSDLLVPFLSSGEAQTRVQFERGEAWLGTLVRVPGLGGLTAFAIAPEGALFGPLRTDAARNVALLLLVTALSLSGAWFASRQLIGKPLDEIGQAVEALGRGRLDARSGVTRGPSELRTLAQAFDRMADALETRDEEVRSAQSQLQATHEQLAHAQKMEAVGQLTGGIAHDFNNLLTVIKGCLGLLDPSKLPDEDKELITQAVVASERGVELTSRLLAFSRRQHLSPARLDLNALILGMRPLLSRTLGEATRVEYDLADPGPKCVADANQLEAALLNLALNGRDAMPNGGRLVLSTEWCDAREDTAPDLEPGRYALLTVTDEGVGMSPEVAARAIEPFFTTKERGRGTGLGLSGAYGFAQQSGGSLSITTTKGVGTTVSVFLPAQRKGVAAETDPESPNRRTSSPLPA